MLRIVNGSELRYRGPVRLKIAAFGIGGSGDGGFDGAFRPDGGEFNVRFEVSSGCTLKGIIKGTRP